MKKLAFIALLTPALAFGQGFPTPTFNSLILQNPLLVSSGGTGTTSSTGTGSLVLSNSPSITGTPTAPTATAGTNTTQVATTAFVGAALVNYGATPTVATNSALAALSTATTNQVWRLGFTVAGDAPPLTYIASASACSLNSGAGDNGSQVQSANGKCWIASFGPGPADVREWGAKGTAIGTAPTVDSTAAWQAAVNAVPGVSAPAQAFLITGSITMPQGVKIMGQSKHGSIIPTTTQSQFGSGTFIYLTGTTASPFVYASGDQFIGLTFYYPNQLRTATTPIVYPYIFTFNPALSSTILVDDLWEDVQFVNAYQGINAQVSHLDFVFNRIQGFAISNAINIDGGGGGDYLNQINLSFYYFGQTADPINTWTLANGVILKIGRSDDIDMQEVFIGTGFIALETYVGTVNTAYGPYGNVRGLSIDACTNGIVSLGTYPGLNMDVHGFLANTTGVDFQASTAVSRWQFTGFMTWGPRSQSFLVGYAGNYLKLSDGQISTGYTTNAVAVAANAVDLSVDHVLFQGAAPAVVTTGFNLNSLLLSNNSMLASTNQNTISASYQVIKDNIGISETFTNVASAASISVTNSADNINLTGTTTVTTIVGGWIGRRVYFCNTGGAVTFGTGGNILGNETLVQNVGNEYIFDGTSWHPMH
ncbi:hypothetical protein [Caballeronia sp. 15711]|uniref:hypothetical protein n=1 Tax=Caballeronia sp. 15711 TaxID=3391029 RepID=UPI0039E5339D